MLYKRELINSFETIGYSCCIMMSIVIRPKWSFYSCCNYIGLLGTGFIQVFYLGRAPRTRETLLDFLKWRRVTRHPLVFRGLTGSQRTPGKWGVTDCFLVVGCLPYFYCKNFQFIRNPRGRLIKVNLPHNLN